jgi:uncharacterized protein (TIGR02466 family)
MNAIPLFANLLSYGKLDIDLNDIRRLSYDIKNNQQSRSFTNKGGFQSDFVDDLPEMQDLIFEIEIRLENLREIFKFKDAKRLAVESMWININPPFSYNNFHTHINSYISGVFYIDVPENSGNIEFKHPAILQPLFVTEDIFEEYNAYNSSKWIISPEQNQLIMFPGWLEHGVSQNLSEHDRISIAFNTEFIDK